MTQSEFARRFAEEVPKISFREKKFPFGRDPMSCVLGVAATYSCGYLAHGETPENYAREDAHLWE
ncbi:hypothetical protein GCM10010924_39290 [Rhizobium wenxiniae]|nr:hypothetical protein GCM10010924_39290 [Rhizobium wenxiniae]